MNNYFVFGLKPFYYAVSANLVQEVVNLPELTLLSTVSADVVGVFDLRGSLIPVLDVRPRFRQACQAYQASDCIVLLAIDEQVFGLIVNEIYDVCSADSQQDNPLLFAASINAELPEPLLIGSITKDEKVITVLNAAALLQQAFFTAPTEAIERQDFYSRAQPNDHAVFALRAEKLKWREQRDDASGYLALAVVVLNGEYFGVDLLAVREFANIGDIVPIPCTPDYVLGCINLRGNVITLIDMRHIIHLPPQPVQADSKAVVINGNDDFAVALLVDNVPEVIYADPAAITPLPSAVASVSGDYLTGEMPYQDKLLTLLDLKLILAKGELVIDDEV
jgi:purine-binding chemotaxis protein CheW